MAAVPPVYNPALPYLGPILGGMSPGKMIAVQGTAHPNADRFSINLQCGPNTYSSRDDIALHMDVRFSNSTIVRNSLLMQQWGAEELQGPFPLSRGQTFDFLILAEPHCYKIALNGLHYAEFGHRTPMERVSYLTIDGHATISCIRIEGGVQSYAPPPGGVMVPSAYAPPPAHVPGYSSQYVAPQSGYAPYPTAATYPVGQVPPPPPGAPSMYPRQPYAVAVPGVYPTVIHQHSPRASPHSRSSAIPIVGGAAAGMLAGAALFGRHHKFKKFKHKHKWMKKAFKHKHKFKYHHHGFHGFHHGSSSSSSEEE